MADRAITITVVDSKRYGVSNVAVKTYGGTPQYTNSKGQVVLMLSGTVSIYVNGYSAYNGSASRLEETEIFDKLGNRLTPT